MFLKEIKLKRMLIFCGLLASSTNVFAACSNIACTGKVTELYLRDIDDVFVRVDQDLTALDCSPHGDKYITVLGTHKNADKIYAALLAAKAQNTTVKLRIRQGTSNCAVDYVQVF